jgi:NAD(P)-dependent dehydrogenase (short-subunit alcohol dehydrogenase family)
MPVVMTARSILITGCSSGIGLAAARTLKTRGWQVFATARKAEDLDRLANEEGVEAIPLDLAEPRSVAACAEAALSQTNGRLFALYNNAASGAIGAMEDISGEDLRHYFEVNVIGTHELTRRIIPAMRAIGTGRIVNCSSVLGIVCGPFRGAYCATKFALEAMTDALRYELAGSGIRVSLLQPGPIHSNFLATTVATFKANIDMANSPHRATYERRLRAMEAGTSSRLKLSPNAVVAKLIHALESPRPKARYMVSPHTYGAAILKRTLPGRALDMLLVRT